LNKQFVCHCGTEKKLQVVENTEQPLVQATQAEKLDWEDWHEGATGWQLQEHGSGKEAGSSQRGTV
jgi:hypothetical protein